MTMKDRRQKLSSILHDILGSDNVYCDPPESTKIKYPAIIYSRAKIDTRRADNQAYLVHGRYDVTFIRKNEDNDILDKFLEVPYCEHNRHFISNNLHHDVFTIFI